jgi:hypothetical protein
VSGFEGKETELFVQYPLPSTPCTSPGSWMDRHYTVHVSLAQPDCGARECRRFQGPRQGTKGVEAAFQQEPQAENE